MDQVGRQKRSPSLLRGLLVVLGLAILALLATVGPARQSPPREVVIGLNVELTGGMAEAGRSSHQAAQLAVEEVNAEGGLLVAGRRYPVRLVVRDNGDRSGRAATAARQLAYEEQVFAIVGPLADRNAAPAALVAAGARTPMVVPSPEHAAPDGPAHPFLQTYESRFGSPPDEAALHTYQAFRTLFAAIQAAGRLDRQAVRALLPAPGSLPAPAGVQ